MSEKISDEEIRDYVALLKMGWGYKKVGEKYGKSGSTVHGALKKREITVIKRQGQSNPKYNEDLELKAVAAYKFGMSSHEVAKKFKISPSTICKYLKTHNIPARTRSAAVKKTLGKSALAAEYWRCHDAGLSLNAIAERYKVNQSQIGALLKRHGYKLRSNSESAKLRCHPKPIRAILPAPKVQPTVKPTAKPQTKTRSKGLELLDRLIAEQKNESS